MGDLAGLTAPYRAVLGSRIRAQRSYRTSFLLDLSSSVLVGLVELAEVWVVFHAVTELGGLDLAAVVLVFGLADLAFSLADLAFGHCDTLPTYLRAGTLDVFYLRPQPLLLQLVTSDISLRRLARAAVGAVALGVGLAVNDVPWSVGSVALVVLSLVSGVATFAAMFVWAAGAQFYLVDGAEATNAFVYGGRYAATQPASVWGRPLVVVFGFFFPMAFTAYLPVVTLLGLPGPDWMPGWLGWCAPLAALWAWALALLTWRAGVRHYQGGGG
ncbi:ABC-2 family transporter protein [Nocardioides sp. YIM 152315]|uniref:ABC transporter permease n=1 Tax=Nocardioides sp. YIM 152315 TaxID=3031760 RepID=UPI0023DA2A40|nr:ABC-2 family transporter protein [Nocardioides sp. YIM 152315]MDF1606325.1 ABC-2 family transporter protein [Nocardioides sp. YIM 152315]